MQQVASLSLMQATQVIEKCIFHELMGQGATRNLGSYGRQLLKVSAKISQKLAMYTIDQVSHLDFDVQNQIIEKYLSHPLMKEIVL
jgi:hypothetical protein